MSNMEYSVDQHGTLHRLEDVSRLYSSDEGIGYGSSSYVAGYSQPGYSQPSYSQPSHTSPHGISDSALYDFHESAKLFACSMLYTYSTGVQVPTQVIAANSTSHSPLRNFGTSQPKYFKGVGGQFSDELKAKYRRDFEAYIKNREQLEKELKEETGLTPSRTTEGETLQAKQRGEVDSTSAAGSKSVTTE